MKLCILVGIMCSKFVFKGYKVRTDNINTHAVKLQTIKLLTMFSPDKTLYSEILLPAVFKHSISMQCYSFISVQLSKLT